MNNFNVQSVIMMTVSTLLLSMLFIGNVEARGQVKPGNTESDFLTYCEEGGAGKSATSGGKYYCCLKYDDNLLGNKCITCDVDTSGSKSNCVVEKRVPPRGRFEPPMKNTNGDMAPAENPPATRHPPSRINGSNTGDWKVYRR